MKWRRESDAAVKSHTYSKMVLCFRSSWMEEAVPLPVPVPVFLCERQGGAVSVRTRGVRQWELRVCPCDTAWHPPCCGSGRRP